MYITSTNHDAVTSILENVAYAFVAVAGNGVTMHLHSQTPSDAASVHRALTNGSGSEPLLMFAHGTAIPPEILAQDQLPAIDARNQSILANRCVFAFACQSSVTLATAARNHNAAVVGYSDALMVPLQKRYSQLFRDSLLRGAELLVSDSTKTTVDAENEMKATYQRVERQLLSGSTGDMILLLLAFQPNNQRLTRLGPARGF